MSENNAPGQKDGYSLEPKEVKKIETKYRTIKTKIPVPESLELIKRLRNVEAYSLHWQFPVIWDHAEGFQVYDKYGNKWLDLSSGIAVTNVGHGRAEIKEAIKKQLDAGLLYNFTFPSEIRLKLLEELVKFTPPYLNKAFLMSAGSEACENLIKLIRKYGHKIGGTKKNIIISYENGFHGRTLGSQLIGGIPSLKDWIVHKDPDIYQVPYPDGFYTKDRSFDLFEKKIKEFNIDPDNVAGIIVEPVQGSTVNYMPVEYVKSLRKWCDEHKVLLAFDEVQTGFGRTGKPFAFMHYEVEADLISLGKALSSSLPISATVARKEIMDVFPPGTMTSTHTGNPISAAAALQALKLYETEPIIQNSEELGKVLKKRVDALKEKYDVVRWAPSIGLFAGLHIFNPKSDKPDKQLAYDINQRMIEKGVMVVAPVGFSTIKIAPPLIITEEALNEAMDVVDEAIGEISKERGFI
ncbi:MAG: class-III pyridoxal-phosphate-dependent aminotransferase [Promethearchaeota archaeon]